MQTNNTGTPPQVVQTRLVTEENWPLLRPLFHAATDRTVVSLGGQWVVVGPMTFPVDFARRLQRSGELGIPDALLPLVLRFLPSPCDPGNLCRA